jgi:hypothetical protein
MKDVAIDKAKNPMAFTDTFQPEDDDDEDDDDDEGVIDRCKLLTFDLCRLIFCSLAEERGPGEYIDVTRLRRQDNEGFSWPRPG